MANHDSRKRAAGRKPVGKRALSLLMALVMSLRLVQITAFAAETGSEDQIMPGYYEVDANGRIQTKNGVALTTEEPGRTGAATPSARPLRRRALRTSSISRCRW